MGSVQRRPGSALTGNHPWRRHRARTPAQLPPSRELLEWVAAHALPVGVLAEQIHPYAGAPLSVSPLTWSHAAFVESVHQYLDCRPAIVAGAWPGTTDSHAGDGAALPDEEATAAEPAVRLR